MIGGMLKTTFKDAPKLTITLYLAVHFKAECLAMCIELYITWQTIAQLYRCLSMIELCFKIQGCF